MRLETYKLFVAAQYGGRQVMHTDFTTSDIRGYGLLAQTFLALFVYSRSTSKDELYYLLWFYYVSYSICIF